MLVLAGNALVMFVGWEGVGLASYLLIGFWFQKKSAADAGKKAFIVNRIGDFGFLIGMFLLLANFGTLTFSEIAAKLAENPGWTGGVVTVIALCLLLGATGKSRAVAALHLAARCDGGPDAGLRADSRGDHGDGGRLHDGANCMCCSIIRRSRWRGGRVGGATALFAATIALVQNDIKQVLAYSTISQLGTCFWDAAWRRIRRRSSI